MVGDKNLKSAEPLSEGYVEVLVLDSSFQKQGEGKKIVIAIIMFLVASDSKQLFGKRTLMHFLI